MAKIHFRPYNPNQTVLFPQRIDEDIADNDPVRMVDALVESLNLESFRKLYKGMRPQPLPSPDDAQGHSVCLHEQRLLLPENRKAPSS